MTRADSPLVKNEHPNHYYPFENFIFSPFGGSSVVPEGGTALRHSMQESAMQRAFITAMVFLGVTVDFRSAEIVV
jgi:hypothetical protein